MRHMGLIIALITILVRAEDILSQSGQREEEPVVKLKNHDPWEVVDWYVGAFIGFYEPIIARAYDDDCYSSLFTYGISAIWMSSYFDTGKELNSFLTWMSLLLPASLKIYDTYSVLDVCARQYIEIGKLLHFKDFRTDDELDGEEYLPELSKSEETGTNDEIEGDETKGRRVRQSDGGAGNAIKKFFIDVIAFVKDIIAHPAFKVVQMMITIAYQLISLSTGYVSSYYHFENGRVMGNAITSIFVEFDKWSSNPIIISTKPWERRYKSIEIEFTGI